MRISVPSDKLPNTGVHRTLLEQATKRLHEISLIKMKESGLVNSVFNRGVSFASSEETSLSLANLVKIFRKYVETEIPYSNYAKGGIIEKGAALPSSIAVPFFFKERSTVYKDLKTSTSEGKDTAQNSVAGQRTLGVPPWIIRYVARINREIMKHKLPIWVSVTCAQYLVDDYEYLIPSESDERGAVVKIVFHVYFFSWILHNSKEDYRYAAESAGEYGRGRRVEALQPGYFVYTKSFFDKNRDKVDSGSPYLILFHLEAFKQVLKTLYRKVEYVPTVYSITPV